MPLFVMVALPAGGGIKVINSDPGRKTMTFLPFLSKGSQTSSLFQRETLTPALSIDRVMFIAGVIIGLDSAAAVVGASRDHEEFETSIT